MRSIPSSVRTKIALDISRAQQIALRQFAAPIVMLPADFHEGVNRSGGAWACWPWRKGVNAAGYGHCRVQTGGVSKPASAHRAAYYAATGYWNHGRTWHVIRHLCHNPACCNPRHLLVGTRADNVWDAQMEKQGIDLVAVRMLVGEGPFLPVAGIADDPFPASRGRVFA